ncbi:hypothetical protein D3C80_1545610 [compost metagenome]
MALYRQRLQRPHHQHTTIVITDRPRHDLVAQEDRIHVVGFFPSIDELRLHAHGLASDHVLDLTHLVVTLVAADDLLEYGPQFAALPGVEATFQLRLPNSRRVLAVQLAENIRKQQALARSLHDGVH